MNKTAYKIIQWTWGFPQTLAGFALYLAHRNDRHFDFGEARATAWNRSDGVSLGGYIFAPDDENMLLHEYGHTKQSLALGPFYLLLVGIPSLFWNRLPYFRRMRKMKGKSYDSMIIERTATALGNRKVRD